MTAAPQQPDPLEWVRVAIDGLRHSQNILLGSTLAGFAMLLAMMGFMLTELGGDIKGLGDDMKGLGGEMRAMEQRIIARMDTLDAKLTDTRERVIRLEERSKEVPP
jgi:hypothetical protein